MAARAAILEATSILLSDGYEHLTIEGVARRAGVGKQTIYRWWSSRGELLVECVEERLVLSELLSIPRERSLGHDLTAWASRADARAGELLRSLVLAALSDPRVAELLRVRAPFEDALLDRIELSAEAGELRAHARPALLARAIMGHIVLMAVEDSRVSLEDFVRDLVSLAEGSDQGSPPADRPEQASA